MDVEAARACLDRSAVGAVRHFGRHADGAVVRDGAGTLLVAAASRFPGALHNAALRCDPAAPAGAVLAAAREFGAEHDRELVLWVSEHADGDLAAAARAAGCAERPGVIGMAIDRAVAGPARLPDGVELRAVVEGAGVAAFASVHRALFGPASTAVAHFASPGALLAANATGVVAYRAGRAVACAMVIVSGAGAGVYWVATVPDERRQGLGAAVTAAAVRAGFRHGAGAVVLQATAAGAGLYRELGFAEHTRYRRYLIAPGVGEVR